MSEFSALLLSDLILFCSSIFSHPLYFSYFIFFSPYLFKIFSFLSPLLVTTTLFVLSFFTLSPSFLDNQSAASICHLQLSESKIIASLLANYRTLVEKLRSEVDDHPSDGFGFSELLEACKMVFDTSTCHEAKEYLFDECLDEKSAQITRPEKNQVKAVVKIFENFLQDKEGVENNSWKKRDRHVKSPSVESNKGEVQKQGFVTSDPKVVTKPMVNSHRVTESGGNYNYNSSGNLGSRKEKEWKRTLACKLFEERCSENADGDEAMDLLWETYETESNKAQLKSSSNKVVVDDYNGIDEYEYEEESVSQLCCLHALKFSAGKMNLGMGRSNIVKISKALKGFGWLHNASNRHGKRRYPLN
ncbi:Detected protein of unknown function [Hibiscus syriacus]|uniref:Uncharacterized protein n=1 Tax=Hibiscus syriacus TaxID=106335 RepID=A0A6A2XB13_HIBSY|nr:uncharacterized protein LOC120190125 [Hibiscus syriacus]KAE8659316.1 Detected protein of unknown function [Hibiscus syriacus]